MAERQPNTIIKVLFSLILFPLMVFLIKGQKDEPATIKRRFKATHKKVILFIIMFSILVLMIIGIIITLWYTFGKDEVSGEVPAYVSAAIFNNKGVC